MMDDVFYTLGNGKGDHWRSGQGSTDLMNATWFKWEEAAIDAKETVGGDWDVIMHAISSQKLL